MNAQTNLLSQLDDALGQSDILRRGEILRRVTDLFVAGSGSFAVVLIVTAGASATSA